jgi:hypothetical protein
LKISLVKIFHLKNASALDGRRKLSHPKTEFCHDQTGPLLIGAALKYFGGYRFTNIRRRLSPSARSWRWAIFAGQEKKPLLVGSFYGPLADAKEHANAAISRLKERAQKPKARKRNTK